MAYFIYLFKLLGFIDIICHPQCLLTEHVCGVSDAFASELRHYTICFHRKTSALQLQGSASTAN